MKLSKRIVKCLSIFMMAFMLSTLLPVTGTLFEKTAEAAVKINKKAKTMYVGSSYKLKVTGTTKHVSWKSSNKKIVTVSSKGKVTAKNPGSATVTALIGSNGKVTKLTCKIRVKPRLSLDRDYVECTTDDFEVVYLTFKNDKDGEGIMISTAGSEVVKAKLGDWDGDTLPIYLTPLTTGVATITVYITQGSGLDMSFSDTGSISFDVKITEGESDELDEWMDLDTIKSTFANVSIRRDGNQVKIEDTTPDFDGFANPGRKLTLALPQTMIPLQEYTSNGIKVRLDEYGYLQLNIYDLQNKMPIFKQTIK
ncbi:Ig-like domain-containing protein [Anaerolentibacter hominis]|uniref:Ig-like domain-containing protein n=1 Tax=Anaerolentibacter hominis TaxID=3079009 RepID=UPI0031B84E3B